MATFRDVTRFGFTVEAMKSDRESERAEEFESEYQQKQRTSVNNGQEKYHEASSVVYLGDVDSQRSLQQSPQQTRHWPKNETDDLVDMAGVDVLVDMGNSGNQQQPLDSSLIFLGDVDSQEFVQEPKVETEQQESAQHQPKYDDRGIVVDFKDVDALFDLGDVESQHEQQNMLGSGLVFVGDDHERKNIQQGLRQEQVVGRQHVHQHYPQQQQQQRPPLWDSPNRRGDFSSHHQQQPNSSVTFLGDVDSQRQLVDLRGQEMSSSIMFLGDVDSQHQLRDVRIPNHRGSDSESDQFGEHQSSFGANSDSSDSRLWH